MMIRSARFGPKARTAAVALLCLFSKLPPAFSQPRDFSPHVGVGLTTLGGQVRAIFHDKWAAEIRYLTGSEGSDLGEVRAHLYGLRGYRFFSLRGRTQYYLGAEAAFYNASNSSRVYETEGRAAGGFAGMERALWSRWRVGVDVGPYVLSTEEKVTKVSDTNIDFVLNAYLLFYAF